MILLILSFVAGVLTVLAPCILPLLPVIVGSSVSGNETHRRKALIIITSLGISVIAFTFLLKVSTVFIHIPQSVWTWISGLIVLFFGLVTLFPRLWESQFMARLNARSNILLGRGNQRNNFWGDVIIGAALGPVFSTCSPTYFVVLATVLPASLLLGTIYLLAYTIGLCTTLFVISLVGQRVLNKLGVASDPDSKFKKVLGVIFIIVGIAILTGIDKKIETKITTSGFLDITKVEQYLLQKSESSKDKTKNIKDEVGALFKGFLPLAPDISTPDGFINTDGKPISISELRGKKVVLIDFWTYSCINCQRTIPYLNNWYEKYKDQGLEIIGVHTPEFAFEKVQGNVEKAVKDFGIKYPVVLDNDFSTWKSYDNKYWPRKYLADIEGRVIYDHIGEGGYEETEKAIQKALAERAEYLKINQEITTSIETPKNVMDFVPGKVESPEIYFGSDRNEYLANGRAGWPGEQKLAIPAVLQKNGLYLSGTWNFDPEYAVNKTEGGIMFRYEAKNVYMVANADTAHEIEIWQDGKLLKKIVVKEETLYTLIENADYGVHTLEIKIKNPGLKAFTFTFG